MSVQENTRAESADLPITLYLNQRATFDLVAASEGGLSHFSTVQTTSSGKQSSEMSGEAQVGIGNAFGLFGLKLGGGGSRGTEQGKSASTIEEKVHTPASLFARLRMDLRDRSLIQNISSSSNLPSIRPGDFVEFEATLRKSPFVEMLSALASILDMTAVVAGLEEQPQQQAGKGSRNRNQGATRNRSKSETNKVADQVKEMLSALTAEGSKDLVAEVNDMRVLLTVEENYFIDPTMNDVVDGTFRVFGKATRILSSDSQGSISLVRKSPLGKFGGVVKGLADAVATMAGGEDVAYTGVVETEINAPAMQVIPIAIFS